MRFLGQGSMRLVCPNCDAEYEVDDDAIPEAGRDVQCSNCGHAWFQLSPRIEAEAEAEAAVFDPPPDFAIPEPPLRPSSPAPRDPARRVTAEDLTPAAASVADPDPAMPGPTVATPAVAGQTIPGVPVRISPAPEMPDADAPDAVLASFTPLAPRTIDDSVLAVLREEAERETAARRDDASRRIEIQTEMPLSAPQAPAAGPEQRGAARYIARMKGLDPDPSETGLSARSIPLADAPTAAAPAPDAPRPSARRDLLPDIEEINSTLRASNDRNDAAASGSRGAAPRNAAHATPRKGFRNGFVLMLLVAVLLVAPYALAPRLAAQFPQTSDALGGYVATVDAARLWLDEAMRSAVGLLEG